MKLKLFINIIFSVILFLICFNLVSAVDSDITIYSPNYFDNQNNIYDYINYVEGEDLSFVFCPKDEAEDINFSIKCGNENVDIEVNDFSKSCYYSNYDLSNLSCDEFELNVLYKVENQQKKEQRFFKKQKRSDLANILLSKDYKSLSALDLSYYLIALKNIKPSDNILINNVYDLIKNKRNNEEKCWPSNNCDLSETIEILRNLKIADYSQDSRLLEDGQVYVEKNIIKRAEGDSSKSSSETYEGEFRFFNNFSSNEEIECDLKVDDEDSKTYEYEEGDEIDDLILSKSFDDSLILECDDEFDKIEFKVFKEKIKEDSFSNDDEIDFEISDSDKNKYDEFKYVLRIDHNFDEDEEIECDLTIDEDDSEDFDFDNETDVNDFIFKGDFDDKIKLECDEDIDDIYLDVYADIEYEEYYDNKEEIDYKVSSSNKREYKIRYDVIYDFYSDDEELECVLNLDESSSKTYTFDNDDNLIIDDKEITEKANLECDKEVEEIRYRLYDSFNNAAVDEIKEDTSSHSHSVPKEFGDYSCIGEDNKCSYKNSVQALYIFSSDIKESNNIESFIDSFVEDHGNEQIYVEDTNIIKDTSLYLIYKSDEDLVEYLKYKQNNIGSWGDDNIIETSLAVLALENTDSNSEHFEDGKDWIYFEEPDNGWGSYQKNGIAYTAIKEKLKPYLVINSENFIDNSTKFILKNPTIYDIKDLKVGFDDGNEYISGPVDLGSLGSKEEIYFNLSVNDNLLGNLPITMTIEGVNHKNSRLTLIEIPISLKGNMPFYFEENKFVVFEGHDFITLNIIPNIENYNYSCNYKNPFNNEKENIDINKKNKKIKIGNKDLISGNYSFSLKCSNKEEDFKIPVFVNVEKVNKTFEVTNSNLQITSMDDFAISVKNLKDDKLTVTISVDGMYKDVIESVERGKLLAKDEERDIYFKIVNPDFLNSISDNFEGNIIFESDNGYKEKVSLNFDVSSEKGGLGFMWYSIIFVILLIVLFVILVFVRYRKLQNENKQQEETYQDEHDMVIDDLDFE